MLMLIFGCGLVVGGAVATVGWALWADRAMRGGL